MKPVISQLGGSIVVGNSSISGTDVLNNDPMVLEFYTPSDGHAVCVGEILLGTRFFYFPFAEMNGVMIALSHGYTVKIKGEEVEDNWISRVDWKYT